MAKKKTISFTQNPQLDIIAPASLKVETNSLRLGDTFTRTVFISTYPRYLYPGWLSPIINLDTPLDLTLYVHPSDSGTILKNLRKQVAPVQSQMMIEEEKGRVRNPVLQTAHNDLEQLRDSLQQGTERFFKFGVYLTLYANSEKELDERVDSITGLLESKLVYSKPAIFQMDKGFKSTLPLLSDKLLINTSLNTEPLSSSFPFTSSDLTTDKGILYGINRHNNSLVLFDRFSMENYNMAIFATTGAGKSYLTKLEILRSLMRGVDVMVIDPENEYQYLAEAAGGSFIKMSLTSPHHINPFDLGDVGDDEKPEDVFRSNIVSLIGLLRIMIGERTDEGPYLTPTEEAILNKALIETYALKDIKPNSDFSGKEAPLLHDLVIVLEGIEGGHSLAQRLEKYTQGVFAGFIDKPSNINLKKGLVVFNIRDMEEDLRPVAMYIILHYIWNTVRGELKKRLLVIDEAWWMMKNQDGAAFLYSMVKRARKYYLGVTTVTQDISDFINSPYGKPILTNSALKLLMKQSPAAIDELQKTFYLTDEEKFLLLESNVGEGIFFAGLKRAAIKVIASYSEDQVITSDPEQLLQIKAAKESLTESNGEPREGSGIPGGDVHPGTAE